MEGKKGRETPGHSAAARAKPCRKISQQADRPKKTASGQQAYLDWLAAASARRASKVTS